jgi:phenylalanine ammonia-lyase
VFHHFQHLIPDKALKSLVVDLFAAFNDSFPKTSTMDGPERVQTAARATVNSIMDYLLSHPNISITAATGLPEYQKEVESHCLGLLVKLRGQFLTFDPVDSPVRSILGTSRDMYFFVRSKLGIRMHGIENLTAFEGGLNTKERTVGESVSLIFEVRTYRLTYFSSGDSSRPSF